MSSTDSELSLLDVTVPPFAQSLRNVQLSPCGSRAGHCAENSQRASACVYHATYEYLPN